MVYLMQPSLVPKMCQFVKELTFRKGAFEFFRIDRMCWFIHRLYSMALKGTIIGPMSCPIEECPEWEMAIRPQKMWPYMSYHVHSIAHESNNSTE
jgi:hypothetical protein